MYTISKIFNFLLIILLSNILFVNLILSQSFQHVNLKEVLSIGNEDSEELYQWAGICVDKKGNIYVTDIMDYSIKKFDKFGKMIKKVGRKGKGPGEFTAIRLIDYHESFLYVTDQFNPGIHVFDDNLNYKSHIRYNAPIIDIQVISKNNIMISTISTQKNRACITCIDSLGNEIYSTPYLKNVENFMMGNAHFFYNYDDENKNNIFYIALMWQDVIKKIDDAGTEFWVKSFLGGIKSNTKDVNNMVLPKEIVYKDITCDKKGNVFILCGSYSTNKSKEIYILTPQGKFITSIILPEPSHCIYIDYNNYLYSRAGMGTCLKKYELIYNLDF